MAEKQSEATQIVSAPLPSGMYAACAIAAATLIGHCIFNGGYGYFRDEFDYLACAQHPAWGYVDQPPMIPMLAGLGRMILGDSLRAVRFLPALASSLTVVLAALIAREMGRAAFRGDSLRRGGGAGSDLSLQRQPSYHQLPGAVVLDGLRLLRRLCREARRSALVARVRRRRRPGPGREVFDRDICGWYRHRIVFHFRAPLSGFQMDVAGPARRGADFRTECDLEFSEPLAFSATRAQHQGERPRCGAHSASILPAADSADWAAQYPDLAGRVGSVVVLASACSPTECWAGVI